MASELELKLAACPNKLNEIKGLDFPGIASQSPWQSKHLANVYFDNSDFKLRELGIGVRIRTVGDRLIQCVKSSGKAIGGLHQRNEDEIDLESHQLDISQIQEP